MGTVVVVRKPPYLQCPGPQKLYWTRFRKPPTCPNGHLKHRPIFNLSCSWSETGGGRLIFCLRLCFAGECFWRRRVQVFVHAEYDVTRRIFGRVDVCD